MKDRGNITWLVGEGAPQARPMAPYNALACDFLHDLSETLRASKEASNHADIMTFAFWCRKGHVHALKDHFEDGRVRLGLGLALHITPGNVPINFAFSFAFGLLSGNTNIVRVPTKPAPQTDLVCNAVKDLLTQKKYEELQSMTSFVRYAQNDDITREFSKSSHARLIWGGNETIRTIRSLPSPERCVDLTFADRYSFCVLDAASVEALGDKDLNTLVKGFYNDTYLMDQNACSSPHLVVWLGENTEKAKTKFWKALSALVRETYNLEPVHAVDKYTQLCRNAIDLDHIKDVDWSDTGVFRVGLTHLDKKVDERRGRCGYFYECDLAELSPLAEIINSAYQTLTYFGVDKEKLQELVCTGRVTGVDRIVPVGMGLEIGVVWDGYDVVRSLSRIIDLR
ncbi:MAG: acyl-CoA reductase [Myxococcota bacterium]|nr:acyl-CoA reductase [Myxococcota bacterium]